ncbi:MAG: acyl-CoA dehydrogenase [Firmicutes bacterium]|nr:acyl-CoA dehydrogenase [Bacillota bacterium]
MNFGLSDQQKGLQSAARQFAEESIKPVASKYDDAQEFPWEVVHKAYAAGLMNLRIPKEYGGRGLDNVSSCLVMEELAAGCAGISNAIGVNNLATLPILIAGTREQKERFFAPLCSGLYLAAFGLTEAQAGSDVAAMKTVARREGDEYRLNGAKWFISNGGVANLYTVFASVDPEKKSKGITAFVVPRDTPGLTIGKRADKMGIRASDVSEVLLENVCVPVANRLGEEGDGFKIAMKTLDASRPEVAAEAVGIARAALEAAIAYSKERQTFEQPISNNQAIRMLLADMATDVDTARLLVHRAAWFLDQGLSPTLEGAMAKCRAADVAVKVATEAVQIFGGYGYLKDYPVEKLMRDAKIYQIFEGTNQINRLVIAREILR